MSGWCINGYLIRERMIRDYARDWVNEGVTKSMNEWIDEWVKEWETDGIYRACVHRGMALSRRDGAFCPLLHYMCFYARHRDEHKTRSGWLWVGNSSASVVCEAGLMLRRGYAYCGIRACCEVQQNWNYISVKHSTSNSSLHPSARHTVRTSSTTWCPA